MWHRKRPKGRKSWTRRQPSGATIRFFRKCVQLLESDLCYAENKLVFLAYLFILLTWLEWLINLCGGPAINIYRIIETVITIVVLAVLLFSKRRLYPVNHSFSKTELSVWRVISYGFITTVFLYFLRSLFLYPLDGMQIKDSIEMLIKIGFILFCIAFLIAQVYFIRKGKLWYLTGGIHIHYPSGYQLNKPQSANKGWTASAQINNVVGFHVLYDLAHG